MVSALDSGSSGPGFESWPTLCCVLGQDTLLSQCLSLSWCMGTGKFNAGGNPAILASHPGESRNTRFMLRNRDKLRPDGPLGLSSVYYSIPDN